MLKFRRFLCRILGHRSIELWRGKEDFSSLRHVAGYWMCERCGQTWLIEITVCGGWKAQRPQAGNIVNPEPEFGGVL